MKYEKWPSCLIGAMLAFGLAVSGVGCLVTAFGLDPVDMVAVTAACGVCAVVTAVCFSFRWGGPVLAAAAAVLIGYLLREGTLLLHIESLLYKISKFYDMGYGWGTVWWSGEDLAQVPVTGALGLVGGIVALGTAETVCRRKSAFFTVLMGFLPLAACFVVTDTVPDAPWLWLMTVCIVLLLLTQSVRRKDPKAGLRLTAMLMIPVLLGSMLLFWLNPRSEYQYRLQQVQDTVMGWIGDLAGIVTTPGGDLTIELGGTGAQVDLSETGPRILRQYPMMDVVSDTGGLIYLRGQSLDIYSGTAWSASMNSTGEDVFFPSRNMRSAGRLTVSTRMPLGRKYVPYYLDSSYKMINGTIPNEDSQQEYSFLLLELGTGGNHISGSVTVDANNPILYQCLMLPDSTRKAAEAILDEIFAGAIMPRDTIFYDDTAAKAEQIRSFVQASAWYSLDTQRMPEDEKDFAIWFLRESETGYCVHFASALVVLLRAAGIPARYVTGYTFEASGLTKTVVRAADAHAWVEYLDPNTGWTVLDATPPQWMEDDTDTPTQPTTEPTQDATQPTTEPEPTQDVTRPEPTDPQESVDATEPDGSKGPGEEESADLRWLWTVLKAVAWAAGIGGILAGQYGLRRMLRRRKLRKGHRNTRALAYWQETKRMARLTGQTPPQEMEALAEKAKFSQHTLTAAELMEFALWLEQARKQLKERPWIVRLVIRLIWAVE